MIRLTFYDLNPAELKYYPSIHNGSCNVLYPKNVFRKKIEDTNVKEFNMITKKHEAKTMIKHI